MTIREVKSRIYNSSFGKVLTCFCHHHSERYLQAQVAGLEAFASHFGQSQLLDKQGSTSI